MSNRKPATASKRPRDPKLAARAQRAKQAIVRSQKDSPLRSVTADSTDSPPKLHSNQEAPLAENRAAALQGDFSQMRDSDSKNGLDLSSATANVHAYQAMLLEMAQANMQFALDFAHRLTTIRSPVDFLSVIAEFTNKRVDMFRKYSNEMAELSTKRLIV
jgi:hypothetical protein